MSFALRGLGLCLVGIAKKQGEVLKKNLDCCLFCVLFNSSQYHAFSRYGEISQLSSRHSPYDKLGHFVLYGIASFLCHRATGKKNMKLFNYSIPFGPALFTIFTAVEEMLQGILPNRSASIEDFLFSFCGIAVFYWIGEVWDRKKGH